MKRVRHYLMSLALGSALAFTLCSANNMPSGNNGYTSGLKIGVVNFKTCVEQSKLGKQEQGNFEGLKKQMEKVLEEKDKVLSDLATKMNDADYLDSLTADAETELKRKFRALSQEMSQVQTQYYQTLTQANAKIIQNILDVVTKSATEVAKRNQVDVLLNEESCFYYAPALDLSNEVIQLMDQNFEKDGKDKGSASKALLP